MQFQLLLAKPSTMHRQLRMLIKMKCQIKRRLIKCM
jgi:hypothetical protein